MTIDYLKKIGREDLVQMIQRIRDGHTLSEVFNWSMEYDRNEEKKSFNWFFCLKDTWVFVKKDEHKSEMEEIIKEHVKETYNSENVFFDRTENKIKFNFDGEEIIV